MGFVFAFTYNKENLSKMSTFLYFLMIFITKLFSKSYTLPNVFFAGISRSKREDGREKRRGEGDRERKRERKRE